MMTTTNLILQNILDMRQPRENFSGCRSASQAPLMLSRSELFLAIGARLKCVAMMKKQQVINSQVLGQSSSRGMTSRQRNDDHHKTHDESNSRSCIHKAQSQWMTSPVACQLWPDRARRVGCGGPSQISRPWSTQNAAAQPWLQTGNGSPHWSPSWVAQKRQTDFNMTNSIQKYLDTGQQVGVQVSVDPSESSRSTEN